MQIQDKRTTVSVVATGAAPSVLLLASLSLGAALPAASQSCTLDPLGGEVCLPTTDPSDPNDPNKPNMPGDPNVPPLTPLVGVPPDVIFERMPFRSYRPAPVEQSAAPMPEEVLQPEPEVVPENVPIRGLWNKSGELDEGEALNYLEGTVREQMLSQAGEAESLPTDAPLVTFDGVDYVELMEPITALYSQPEASPGWSVWVRGYGGEDRFNVRDAKHQHVDLNRGGVVLGADLPLSKEFRVGLFGNYSSAHADHHRGSWSPDGWGGGVTADWWGDHVYAQGLVSGNSFTGTHRRSFDGSTYTGDRGGSSWQAALRLGAPIDAGSLYLEPQAQVSWMGVELDRFSEGNNNRDQRLTYNSRHADFLGTQLALKVATPIRSGERSLWMPSLRVGWIANWGQGNDSQVVRYSTGGLSMSYATGSDDANGVLVEAGLDVTTYNGNDTSVAAFVRGGPVFWGDNLGTSWRAWGGLSFHF